LLAVEAEFFKAFFAIIASLALQMLLGKLDYDVRYSKDDETFTNETIVSRSVYALYFSKEFLHD